MRNAAIALGLHFSYEAAAWVNVGRDKVKGQRKKETGEVAETGKIVKPTMKDPRRHLKGTKSC